MNDLGSVRRAYPAIWRDLTHTAKTETPSADVTIAYLCARVESLERRLLEAGQVTERLRNCLGAAPTPPAERYLTLQTYAAKYGGVDVRTVKKCIDAGLVTAIRVGRGIMVLDAPPKQRGRGEV